MSTDENVVTDSWDDDGADPVKAIEERFEKVKIMQRKQEDKKAAIEKVEPSVDKVVTTKTSNDTVAEGPGPSQEEPKRLLLRRPKGDVAEEIPSNNQRRGRKSGPSGPAKTLEERQAEYQAARQRIMGSEYKPDNTELSEIGIVERSKSPETVPIPRVPSSQRLQSEYNKNFVPTSNRQQIPELLRQQLPPPPPPGHDQRYYAQHVQGVYQNEQGHMFSIPPQQNYNCFVPQMYSQMVKNDNSRNQIPLKNQMPDFASFQTPTHIPPPALGNPIPFGCPPMNVGQYMNHQAGYNAHPQSFAQPPPYHLNASNNQGNTTPPQ